jgi:hypothetical protein
MRLFVASALFVLTAVHSAAAESATLTGRVTDGLGNPLENATVLIYQAGVKQGYSTFCPSCYADCGKRTATDNAGAFTIHGLAPDLWFRLLVIRDGYAARFVNKADPARGPAATAVLTPRAPVEDAERVARGRVLNKDGEPLAGAVILPQGADFGDRAVYGTVDGLEPVAVSNARGEFELALDQKAKGVLVWVEARGMATKLAAVPTGSSRTAVAVSPGATVRGRLMNAGKPVANAEIGLIAQERGGFGAALKIFGDPYEEIRIGTQEDGTFTISNVPAPVNWYVYGKMESLAAIGASSPVKCATAKDGEAVNVGDLELHPGYTVRGMVTLNDGAAIPAGMRVSLGASDGFDTQTVPIGADGSFEFRNVPLGKYGIFPSVRGYDLPGGKYTVEAEVAGDISDFRMALDRKSR